MEGLEAQSYVCVSDLLEALIIRRRQSVHFDPDIYYPSDLLELLGTIMGCSRDKVMARFTELSSTQNQRHIDV